MPAKAVNFAVLVSLFTSSCGDQFVKNFGTYNMPLPFLSEEIENHLNCEVLFKKFDLVQ